MTITILFEDSDLLAMAKPAGIPTQATVDKNRLDFYNLAKEQTGLSLYLHHRLDKDTSGILLMSKSKLMNPLLARLFQNHELQKTYWALAHGMIPQENFQIENFLAIQKKGKSTIVKSVRAGGNPAVTRFRRRQQFSESAWLECEPLTGRTHQIRVHLSEMGHPILGDSLYGGKSSLVPRMMLHAQSLKFIHPLTQQAIVIECPAPKDFESVLKNLSS